MRQAVLGRRDARQMLAVTFGLPTFPQVSNAPLGSAASRSAHVTADVLSSAQDLKSSSGNISSAADAVGPRIGGPTTREGMFDDLASRAPLPSASSTAPILVLQGAAPA